MKLKFPKSNTTVFLMTQHEQFRGYAKQPQINRCVPCVIVGLNKHGIPIEVMR